MNAAPAPGIDCFPANLAPSTPVVDGGIFCPECGRGFNRPCDLNKHTKTHTRPYKCSVPRCKFAVKGFPTDQELDRHIVDRHTSNPPMFKCQIKSCQFGAKRESNCKQNMLKKHQMEYKYTSPNKRRRVARKNVPPAKTVEVAEATEAAEAAEVLKAVEAIHAPSAPKDFILFPESQYPPIDTIMTTDAMFDNLGGTAASMAVLHSSVDYPGDLLAESNSFVTWDSPATRKEEIVGIISGYDSRVVSQSSGSGSGSGSGSSSGNGPSCSQSMYPSAITWLPMDLISSAPSSDSLFNMQMAQGELVDASMFLSTFSGTSAADVVQAANNTDHSGQQTSALSQTSQAVQTNHTAPVGVKRDLDEDDEEDGDDDDDDSDGPRRPKKHRQGGGSGRDQMVCPFRQVDPVYFNRENEERFSPCHTSHRYISTLVRHLGRAAHGLVVSGRCISSFDTQEHGNPQPLAGLCRRCWTAFDDRALFDDHISGGRTCEKVSRNKWEKYSIILSTFCRARNARCAGRGVPGWLPVLLPAPPARRSTRFASGLAFGGLVSGRTTGNMELPAEHEPEVFATRRDLQALETRVGSLEESFHRIVASQTSLLGSMERQVDTAEDVGDAVVNAGWGLGIQNPAVQDLSGNVVLRSLSQRTQTGLSSMSSSSSVRHMPPYKTLTGDDGRQPGQPGQPLKAGASATETVADSGYGSKLREQHGDGEASPVDIKFPRPAADGETAGHEGSMDLEEDVYGTMLDETSHFFDEDGGWQNP